MLGRGSLIAVGIFLVCLVLADARTLAQTASSSSRKSTATARAKATTDLGTLVNDSYRNRFFGLSYKVPFGWVDRTEQMRQEAGGSQSSVVLLSVFERPPEAAGNTVNSSVLVAAETVSTYPGLKDASQYFGPLTEVTTSKGFKVVNPPYDVAIGGKALVRADFSNDIGKLTMHQSTLAVIDKGYVVSFTFIAGSEDDVEELIGHLAFAKSPQR
jgi:hypothetical protein